MAEDAFREEAEKHWEFILGLLGKFTFDHLNDAQIMDVFEYVYVEAMIHGYKHGIEDEKEGYSENVWDYEYE
jgi:hypothetical protein